MRLMAGAWMIATPMIRTPTLVPAPVIRMSRSSSGGKASRTSTERISTGSTNERL